MQELYKYAVVHRGQIITPREGYLLQISEVQVLPPPSEKTRPPLPDHRLTQADFEERTRKAGRDLQT